MPPQIREAAERLQHELRMHVEHYGSPDDIPESFNNDLKIVTDFILGRPEESPS